MNFLKPGTLAFSRWHDLPQHKPWLVVEVVNAPQANSPHWFEGRVVGSNEIVQLRGQEIQELGLFNATQMFKIETNSTPLWCPASQQPALVFADRLDDFRDISLEFKP